MADNTTASADPTVATDQVGTVHYQRMKLVDGTLEGTDAIPGTAERGLSVDPRAKIVRLSDTPTISAGTAYAAKDAVGGLLTFASAARASGGSCRIDAVQIVDADQEMANLDLVLFDRSITAPTDNAVFDPTDAELANVVAVIPIGAGAYADFNDNAVANLTGLGITALLNGTDLYGVLVARDTPTYTATSDITVTVTVLQD